MSFCKNCIHSQVCDNTILKLGASVKGMCRHFIDQTDVALIIRCNDCKHHRTLKDGGVQCERIDGLLMTKPNDYCSYGERREK